MPATGDDAVLAVLFNFEAVWHDGRSQIEAWPQTSPLPRPTNAMFRKACQTSKLEQDDQCCEELPSSSTWVVSCVARLPPARKWRAQLPSLLLYLAVRAQAKGL